MFVTLSVGKSSYFMVNLQGQPAMENLSYKTTAMLFAAFLVLCLGWSFGWQTVFAESCPPPPQCDFKHMTCVQPEG
jgi:hypothetical protein